MRRWAEGAAHHGTVRQILRLDVGICVCVVEGQAKIPQRRKSRKIKKNQLEKLLL